MASKKDSIYNKLNVSFSGQISCHVITFSFIHQIRVSVDNSAIMLWQSLNSQGSLDLSDFHHGYSCEIAVRMFPVSCWCAHMFQSPRLALTHAQLEWTMKTNPRAQPVTQSERKTFIFSFNLFFLLLFSIAFYTDMKQLFICNPTADESRIQWAIYNIEILNNIFKPFSSLMAIY